MLIAISKENNTIYYPETILEDFEYIISNKDKFICPACKKRVVFVNPETNIIKHFRHYKKSDCDTEPETINHLNIKKFMLSKLNLTKENLEYPLGFARPDIYIPNERIAIEVQNSSLTLKKFKERTENYTKNNIYVLWIFDYRLMNRNKPPAFIKEAHKIYLGRIYVYVPGCEEFESHIKPVHFSSAGRIVEIPEFDENGRIISFDGYYKYYKREKNLSAGDWIKDFSILKIINPYNNLKIARFYDKRFWEVSKNG